MKKIKDRLLTARLGWRESARTLRRARGLYVTLVRRAIEDDKSDGTINRCAQRMIDNGFYASKCLRTVRCSILREMCRQDGCWSHWHRWYMKKGFACYTWERIEEAA